MLHDHKKVNFAYNLLSFLSSSFLGNIFLPLCLGSSTNCSETSFLLFAFVVTGICGLVLPVCFFRFVVEIPVVLFGGCKCFFFIQFGDHVWPDFRLWGRRSEMVGRRRSGGDGNYKLFSVFLVLGPEPSFGFFVLLWGCPFVLCGYCNWAFSLVIMLS